MAIARSARASVGELDFAPEQQVCGTEQICAVFGVALAVAVTVAIASLAK